ncbi:MAG: hypothetical protein WC661_11855 [Opitutaceae bacterium]|jgi:hypothetical protein
MPLPDAQRRALLEAFYQHSIACEAEKAATKAILDGLLDKVAATSGLSRRDVKDYVRAELYPDYYRRRRVEDRGHL